MTFGQFKLAIRAEIWPTGEAPNLVAAHNKGFVDALVNLQQVVPCLQQDNTDLVPACATFYDCGLTVLSAPRGSIKKVSVIDKTDPTTHKEDPALPDNYCDEIPLNQIDSCHIRRFLAARGRTCCGLGHFFGLDPFLCAKAFPIPTDAGLPPGLKPLPFGLHYSQTSTDRVTTNGQGYRARMGIWAIERGKIWVAPWIQSTETILIVWDGIKRTFADDEEVDSDPLLSLAVAEYLRSLHASRYDRDDDEFARAQGAFLEAKSALIHQCREETRVRECEPSFARSSVPSLTTLFYNASQQATARCPDGSNPVTVTIPAGSVSSSVSVADANARAVALAQQQANAQLNCIPGQQTWTNTAQTFVAQCTTDEVGAPQPDGAPVTVTIEADMISSTVSQADADAQALTLAQQRAESQLVCTFWNALQSFTAVCPADPTNTVTKTVAAHTHSAATQDQADQLALTNATNQANAALALVCPSLALFWNTVTVGHATITCPDAFIGPNPAVVSVSTTVPAHTFSAATQNLANQLAANAASGFALEVAAIRCARGEYGDYSDTYPIP